MQEERRRVYEKRNPLLDRVKSTRLSFFKDHDFDSDENNSDSNDEEAGQGMQFRSMCELRHRDLIRNEFRRSICESDLKNMTKDASKNCTRRKRRAKSQSRSSYEKQQEEQFFFLGFRTSTPQKQLEWLKDGQDSIRENLIPYDWERSISYDFIQEKCGANQPINRTVVNTKALEHTTDETILKQNTHRFDSITPSSCLAAKFRAMQNRYLKSSTNLVAKIYRKDCKDRRQLRSFSFDTLSGFEELRTNPLYEDQDQDDNDSGILDNDSATSFLLDDRCSSGASEPLNSSGHNNSCLRSPPQFPLRRPFSFAMMNTNKATPLFVNLDTYHDRTKNIFGTSFQIKEYSNVCHPANSTLRDHEAIQIASENNIERDRRPTNEDFRRKQRNSSLEAIKNIAYATETIIVKLPRETSDQRLGIFITKSAESSPGYMVAYVVPNGLADKEGTLRIGDEILIVNGKRLRGLGMAEARKILTGNGSGPGDVHIVVTRCLGIDQQIKRLTESNVDYENVSMENDHRIVESSSRSHFKKHQRCHRDKKDESNKLISSEKYATNMDIGLTQNVSMFCTLPRRPRSTISTLFTVLFEKEIGKKSLGFTIVGGKDSPKGSIGIFIKSVLPGGQAAEDRRLRAGDEILAVNGQICHDLTHSEAIQLFRNIKNGSISLHLCRRMKNRELQAPKAKSCTDLLLIEDT